MDTDTHTIVPVGATVLYRPCFGMHAPTTARVTDTGWKNGKPLVGLDNGHWAYCYQIVEVDGKPFHAGVHAL